MASVHWELRSFLRGKTVYAETRTVDSSAQPGTAANPNCKGQAS